MEHAACFLDKDAYHEVSSYSRLYPVTLRSRGGNISLHL